MSKFYGFFVANFSFTSNFTLHATAVELEKCIFYGNYDEFCGNDTPAEHVHNLGGEDDADVVLPVPGDDEGEQQLRERAAAVADNHGRSKKSAAAALQAYRKGYINFLECTGNTCHDRIV